MPMLLYGMVLYLLDRYEREPLSLVIGAFLWGFIPAAFFALISQVVLDLPLTLFLDADGLAYNLVTASIIAPLTEETFKGLALLAIFFLARKELDSLFDGILYGSLIGFGFAAIENIFYFTSEIDDIGSLAFLIIFRAYIFGLNHAFFTSFIGMGLVVARLSSSYPVKLFAPFLGWTAAIVAHSMHNTGATLSALAGGIFLLTILADWSGVVFISTMIVVALRRERSWIITQLAGEVRLGTLSQAQYEAVSSSVKRARLRGQLLMKGDLKTWRKLSEFFHVCTELAYKKHQNAKVGEHGAPSDLINELRTQAATLSRKF